MNQLGHPLAVITVGTGGGGGTNENYVTNPLKSNSATGWNKGSGAQLTAPAWNTSKNLYGGGALLITFGAGTKTINDYFQGDLNEIMASQVGLTWKVKFTAFIDSGATFAADDLIVEYFDGTTTTPINVLPVLTNNLMNLEFALLPTNTIGTTSKLRIRGKTGSTTCVGSLRIADVSIAPSQIFSDPALGPEISWVPTFQGLGTVSGVDAKYTRVGNKLRVNANVTLGIVTGVEARMYLPIGIITDSAIPNIQHAGIYVQSSVGASSGYILQEPGKNYVTFGNQNAGASGLSKVLGAAFSNSVTFSIMFEVSIAQWSNNLVLAGVNEPMYLSNSESTPNTNGVVGKTYNGIEGSAIPANTAATYYDITLPRQVLPNETIEVFFRSKIDGTWIRSNTATFTIGGVQVTCNSLSSSSIQTGAAILKITSGQVRIRFGQFPAIDFGASSMSWAQMIAAADGFDRWRIRIGQASVSEQVPKIYAEATGRNTFTSGTTLPVPFDGTGGSVPTDSHGCITASNGRFNAPVDGLYTISGIWYGTLQATLCVYKNGAFAKILSAELSTNITTPFSRTIKLVKGDFIDIRLASSGVISVIELEISN